MDAAFSEVPLLPLLPVIPVSPPFIGDLHQMGKILTGDADSIAAAHNFPSSPQFLRKKFPTLYDSYEEHKHRKENRHSCTATQTADMTKNKPNAIIVGKHFTPRNIARNVRAPSARLTFTTIAARKNKKAF